MSSVKAQPILPPNSVDVAVIGNGVIGMTIAIKLKFAAPNLHVAVIGPADRAGCATRAAGAMLGCYGEVTERTGTPLGRLRHDMAVAAIPMWGDWLCFLNDRLPSTSDARPIRPLTTSKVILNAVSGEIDTRNYMAIKDAAADKATEQAPDQLPMRPAPGQRPLCALSLDGEGGLDARHLLDVLDDVAGGLGIHIVHGEASPRPKRDGLFRLAIQEHEMRAEKLVLAAGAATTDVLEAAFPEIAARVPPVFPGVGQALLLDVDAVAEEEELPRDMVLRTPNRAFACGLHVVPLHAGQLYVGATNFVGPEVEVNPYLTDLEFLMDCVMGQINRDLEGALLISTLTGNRPVSLDTQPLVGGTREPGLFLCTGTYRDGIQVSPLLGDLMVGVILGREGGGALGASILREFAPERDLLPWGDREDVVRCAVEHFMADIAEAGTTLPWNRWDRRLASCLKAEVERIVDEFSTSDWTLPPDFIPALFEHEVVSTRPGGRKVRSMRERVNRVLEELRLTVPA